MSTKIYLDNRVSNKTGKPYCVIIVDFGDYKYENYLTPEQEYIIKSKLGSK